jgi:hypothetical protein
MQPSSSAAVTKSVPDYYEWNSPASGISILLRLDVVDGMLPGIMEGFSAVPKRGAEAGGILLGTIDTANGAVIRIEDFQAVPCSYRRGPSYLLCESDLAAFEAAIRDRTAGSNGLQVVGYYRSHTREVQALAEDDRSLCARFFPPPHGMVLIVRPYATRACTAGFLTYQDGALPDWPAEQFPFRRLELEGGEPRPRVPLAESPRRVEPRLSGASAAAHPVPLGFSFGGYAEASTDAATPPAAAAKKTRRSSVWIWAFVSLLCLLLGIGAGFLARTFLPADAESGRDPFAVSLSAKPSEDNLMIRWDRDAPAIRYAQGGTLQIIDGLFTKTVELSASELQNGTVIFHSTSDHVSIRLEVLVHENSKIVNAIVWTRASSR